jgi:hypothetical protein
MIVCRQGASGAVAVSPKVCLPALCCCYALLQVLCDSSASEVWRLQLLELLVPDWLPDWLLCAAAMLLQVLRDSSASEVWKLQLSHCCFLSACSVLLPCCCCCHAAAGAA